MRPVRFVALSEDGQALVLADELGRLLGLPLDDRVHTAVHGDGADTDGTSTSVAERRANVSLSPRDIQMRIRTGESAEDIAKGAGVPVDKVLRYAGPVLQERAMLAQAARRARLATSDRGARMSEVVDVKLAQHGVDTASVSWDAYRREDGSWRVTASWSSGKSTAEACWELDRARQNVTPHDEMAQFLSTPAPTSLQKEKEPAAPKTPSNVPARPSRDPLYGVTPRDNKPKPATDSPSNDRPDPLRRDALRAVLERPLSEPARNERQSAGLGLPGSEPAEVKDTPAVPSLAVLRPRRTETGGEEETEETDSKVAVGAGASSKPRNRLPAWEDVLFGTDTTPRSSE